MQCFKTDFTPIFAHHALCMSQILETAVFVLVHIRIIRCSMNVQVMTMHPYEYKYKYDHTSR